MIPETNMVERFAQVTRLFNGNGRTNAGNEGASLGGPTSLASRGKDDTSGALVVHTLRLLENTDRFSSDMQALEKGASSTSTYCRRSFNGTYHRGCHVCVIRSVFVWTQQTIRVLQR